ncbi:MutS-related protein [Leifsonia sp. 22587]|uniref:MutS-related protein n=1 Tax=Leifsonia sp. 22587 TaxID=3453946 RepID=UPI003F8629D8
MTDREVTPTSLLFPPGPPKQLAEEQPGCFPDLGLDQIVTDVLGDDPLELAAVFWTVADAATVEYRHGVFADLDTPNVIAACRTFVVGMATVREALGLARRLRYPRQAQRVLLDAARRYADVVGSAADALTRCPLHSVALQAAAQVLAEYVDSEPFTRLSMDTRSVTAQLDAVKYGIHIQGGSVTVVADASGTDQSDAVMTAFARFKHTDACSHRTRFVDMLEMNRVEAGVLDLVAEVFPTVFQALERFAGEHAAFLDTTVARYERELHLYLSVLDHLNAAAGATLPTCLPELTTDRSVQVVDGYDLQLAAQPDTRVSIVPNDVRLASGEQFLVVTGANQGGKSTFARVFGQLHWMAALGFPVAARTARLARFDLLLTHFERQEDLAQRRGRLEDDLIRVRNILGQVTPDSIVIANELFSSTTAQDALTLNERVLRKLLEAGAIGVTVTFLDELVAMTPQMVSVVAEVAVDDPTRRTFRIVRRPPDGLAHATAIAEKYGLSPQRIRERVLS